ncbi:MAG: DoxX family protein [Bacteroidaceae bacterium]|nr:DoxX family protein [Bacteroidaceae bacterium]
MTTVCRILLGSVFVFSGIVKAIDPVGTQIKFTDYLLAFGWDGLFTDSTLLMFAALLAGVEFLLGIYMLMGVFSKGTTRLLFLMMIVLTPFTLYTALKNPVEDCGCFGDALVLTNWQTFEKNIFLFVMSVYLLFRRRYIYPLVSERRQWLVTVVTVLLLTRFTLNNINGLPVLDFRQYKVGTDLRAEIYEKANPEMADFFILDNDFNDVTPMILEDEGYTFLLVSDHLERADESHLDMVDDLYDYCKKYGYGFMGVTASGGGVVDEWIENNGAEYSFFYSDEIPLQTMVRANPGLVLIKDGVIINKWSAHRMPSEVYLDVPLENSFLGIQPVKHKGLTILSIIMLFGLPLLLIVLIDKLKNKVS